MKLILLLINFILVNNTSYAKQPEPDFKQSVRCFSDLVKTLDQSSGTFQYYTMPKTFIFPKSFLIDGQSDKEGFFLVSAEQTRFCPFKFSIPVYGLKENIHSKFKLDLNGDIYDVAYYHKSHKFEASKSLIGSLMSRTPASVQSLKCDELTEAPKKPLNERISWMIQKFSEAYYKKQASGEKAFVHKYKALLEPCEKINPQIDKLIKGFPGPKPQTTKYSRR